MPKQRSDAQSLEVARIREAIARERARLRRRIENTRERPQRPDSPDAPRARGKLYDIIRACLEDDPTPVPNARRRNKRPGVAQAL
jgi:hypothetical protein